MNAGPVWLVISTIAVGVVLLVWLWRMAGAEDKRRATEHEQHRRYHRDLELRMRDVEYELFGEHPEDDGP